jgi:hypothetical protein
MSLDQPLACACATSGLQLQVSVPDFLLLYCPRCRTIVAGQPVPGDAGPPQVQLLSLSEEEAAQVRQAVTLVADGPLVESLQLLLRCTLPAALRVAQQRLGQRSGLLAELRSALYATEPQARLLTLQLVSRMPQVPRELRPAALQAIQSSLTLDPLGEEVLAALMALYALAASGQHLRAEVARIGRHLEGWTGERAGLTRQVAEAVVAAMDRAAAAAKERYTGCRDQLAALVRESRLDEARAVLAAAYPAEDPEDPDGGLTGRTALCEDAAQTLHKSPGQTSAVRTLLTWALDSAQDFASGASAGGEGMARMVEVNRLRGRLKRLG